MKFKYCVGRILSENEMFTEFFDYRTLGFNNRVLVSEWVDTYEEACKIKFKKSLSSYAREEDYFIIIGENKDEL